MVKEDVLGQTLWYIKYMRIAMISYHTCPLAALGGKDAGGMNVYVRDLTRALGENGIGVDVFTRSQDEHVPHVMHDLGNGNRVVHVPAGPELPLPRDILARYIPEFVTGVRQFIETHPVRYELIHSHYWLSGLAGMAFRSQWSVPLVHMFHTLGVMKSRLGGTLEDPEREAAERKILAVADRIVAATPAERSQLEWLYEADLRKVVVIPPGVDIDVFHPIAQREARAQLGIAMDGYCILFVGRIERLKGIETLLRAAALLRQRGILGSSCGCVKVIGGDPDHPEEEMKFLQTLTDELNMSGVVDFLGKRPQEELPAHYASADVVVMPSQYESFGMVALEAMACGTPVIASGVGGLLYLVQDGQTGFHVPESDPEALADRLQRILEDSNQRREMARQAVIVARAYSWRLIAGQILTLYECALAGSSACVESTSEHSHPSGY
jgi:D-inositol-3-phosphate glycosyltransferase